MVKVTLQEVTKRFGKTTAVNRISVEIEKGEFIVLLGPSGCGKTTLLRCISGLEKVTEGRILFNEGDVTNLPPKDRNISMVFQNYAVWPHLKVKDNIGFPLKIKKKPTQEIETKVKWASEMLGITELLDRYPHQLSGGQRQRVAVARAIVMEPEVLLMDEPLSNLDALLRVKMRSEIKKLQESLKVTTIYVTHDQVEAMTMGDRIAVLKDGKLQQIGGSNEIYHKPTNLFVAGFIGSPQMNFINVEVKEEENILIVATSGLEIPLPPAIPIKKSEYILGIRPEDIHIKELPNSTRVTGEIYFVEALRSDTVLHVNTDFGKLVVKIPGDFDAKEGENISLYIDNSKIHLFEKESELSIL
ncbi:MAG: ABC transporter ATP-binding protein [Synergistetes bacterium]|nr:ABC transporter ATP-binding protein [Synergistota bacterium]